MTKGWEDGLLLHDYLSFHARSRARQPFSRFNGEELTMAQAWTRSGKFASALASLNIGPGTRFGILMRNAPDMVLLIYAASRCGAVPVPLNYRLAPAEWAWILNDAGAAAIISDSDFLDQCDEALPPDLLRLSIGEQHGAWRDFASLASASDAMEPSHRSDECAVLVQMYTSGTTGRPKGALLTQRSIVSNIQQNMAAMPHKINPGERSLAVLPLFHIAALVMALGATSSGGCIVVHSEVDPAAIVTALVSDEIAVATLVPSVIQFLLVSVPGIEQMSFPHLKVLAYGASPIAEAVLRKALAVFDCHFVQGYGMTELSGAACQLSETDHRAALIDRPELLQSTGKPLPGTELRIVSPDASDLAIGKVGEILIRGPQVMSGYWNMPEATQAALKDGWLHTGDAGYLDEHGYLFIRDRVKDMIVSGGENVYPAEIEGVLFSHPQVADAAVIGVPDEKWGETVMAIVVARDTTATVADLDRHCRERLGGFKIPRRYEFVSQLPRNGSGKVLKRELRSDYWPSDGRQVG